MKKRPQKPYWEMTTEELAEATKEFDEEFVIDKCTPLTPEMQEKWEKAKGKPDVPFNGPAREVISIDVEKELLARVDALAKKKRISRSRLIARGLKALLAAEGEL